MWTSEIKPRCFMHVSKSKNITVYHIVDIHLSSSVVERHVFSNSRKCESFANNCSKIMPYYNSYLSSLSFEIYSIFVEDLNDEFTFE